MALRPRFRCKRCNQAFGSLLQPGTNRGNGGLCAACTRAKLDAKTAARAQRRANSAEAWRQATAGSPTPQEQRQAVLGKVTAALGTWMDRGSDKRAAKGARAAASSTPIQAGPPPAGWYPDPCQRFTTRYWDGSAWTDHVQRDGVPATDPVTPA